MIAREAVGCQGAEFAGFALAHGEPRAEGLRIVPVHHHRRVRGALLEGRFLPPALCLRGEDPVVLHARLPHAEEHRLPRRGPADDRHGDELHAE